MPYRIDYILVLILYHKTLKEGNHFLMCLYTAQPCRLLFTRVGVCFTAQPCRLLFTLCWCIYLDVFRLVGLGLSHTSVGELLRVNTKVEILANKETCYVCNSREKLCRIISLLTVALHIWLVMMILHEATMPCCVVMKCRKSW